MTRTNANVIFEKKHPTSYVTVEGALLDSSRELVRLECQDNQAAFYAKPPENDLDDFLPRGSPGVRMHRNVAPLFGSTPADVRNVDLFIVDMSISQDQIPECRSAVIHIKGAATRKDIETLLRTNNYMIHEIEEVIKTNRGMITLDVVDLNPSEYSTLRVTDETDLTFLGQEAYDRWWTQQTTASGQKQEYGDGFETVIDVGEFEEQLESVDEDLQIPGASADDTEQGSTEEEALSTATNLEEIGDDQELNEAINKTLNEIINETTDTVDDIVGEVEQGSSGEEIQPTDTEESEPGME